MTVPTFLMQGLTHAHSWPPRVPATALFSMLGGLGGRHAEAAAAGRLPRHPFAGVRACREPKEDKGPGQVLRHLYKQPFMPDTAGCDPPVVRAGMSPRNLLACFRDPQSLLGVIPGHARQQGMPASCLPTPYWVNQKAMHNVTPSRAHEHA